MSLLYIAFPAPALNRHRGQRGSTTGAVVDELERLRRERDLCLSLLNLGEETDKGRFLRTALDLIVQATESERGYIELHDDESTDQDPTWSVQSGLSDQEISDLRYAVSTSIIAQALKTGEVVDTPSALSDPRFENQPSVRGGRIRAVICVPIGRRTPTGVLYLQGRRVPGPFTDQDRKLAILFAQHVEPLATGLLARRRWTDDPTLPYRRRLKVGRLKGSSHALAELLKQISMASAHEVTILLTGKTGTGKSLVASLIHENGRRSARPFIEVNCAAFNEALIESELFGHERGAFTDAKMQKQGVFERAGGGTLFLDEVTELSRSAQSKLLRVLQEGRFERVGGTNTLKSDARVIAATNADVVALVESGAFRDDLYQRLNVLSIHVPSLADRRSDVLELAQHFVAQACQRREVKPHLDLSGEAMVGIEAAEWRGNIRQLENTIEMAVIRADADKSATIRIAHLFPGAAATVDDLPYTLQQATHRFQRDFLCRTLKEAGDNVAETARRLGISRAHVYNLFKSLNVQRSGDEDSDEARDRQL
jgi:Nif-specific regulatory protein